MNRLNSLRNRVLLLFLFTLFFILLLTLYIVQSATYEHSRGQLLNHASTSSSVVIDKLVNQANLLEAAIQDIGRTFSVIELVASGGDDPASLFSAMTNYQQRLGADMFVVLNEQQQIIASSVRQLAMVQETMLETPGLTWFRIGEDYYLLKATPIKFVPSSPRVNGWILMGKKASELVTEDWVKLTDMQITLLRPGPPNEIMGTTLDEQSQAEIMALNINTQTQLNPINLNNTEAIYTVFPLTENSPFKILLSTETNRAFLSYNSLIIQMAGLLAIAALIALFAAILLSNSIARPLNTLVNAAREISLGRYTRAFPTTSTNEVNTLSDAIRDMQDGIKEREQQIHELAYFDKLTGLANRNQFHDMLSKTIVSPQDDKVTIAMMDVDRFKDINDTVGHDTGDVLLKQIAERLSQFPHTHTMFARIGGDEFGMIFNCGKGKNPESVGEDVTALFEQPFIVDGLVLDINVSIGISVYPFDGKTAQGLMQKADIALYSCKGQHYSVAVYRPELDKHSVQRLNLMSELKEALVEGQLELYYQPKLSIAEHKVNAVECLIRWIHPEHGFIPPDEFIGLAEQTGAIRHVTHWGIKTALKQQRQWRDQGHEICVAVNISAIDLVDMKLPAYVSEMLSEFDIEPGMLILEVTESAIMSDPESAMKALNTLKRMGIILSIDDFGTGFSSMAQLKKMPVHELKIDKAFVLDLASNKDDQVMVKTLVSLAENLGLTTVAEGVEDEDSLAYLREIGCTKAQGFHLSRPLPVDKFDPWLNEFLAQSEDKLA